MRRLLVLAVPLLAGCAGGSSDAVEVRLLDDLVVMTPAEVVAMRSTIPVPAARVASAADVSTETTDVEIGVVNSEPTVVDTTLPTNQDDRPAELKLFDAYANFKSCIEDAGETIRGNLQDQSNPAYQDPGYRDLVQTCAARSKIVDALRETAQARGDLSPDEVRTRNESFKSLSDCLKKRGWTIETRVDEKGLITPNRFESPDGTIDQRDLDQCLSESGISSNGSSGG